jgi:hypothetical protein
VTTLRETIESAVDAQEEKDAAQAPATVTSGDAGEQTAQPSDASGSTPAQAPEEEKPKGAGRTAGRARDEHGKLLPGPADPAAKAAKAAPVAPQEPELPPIQRPSSWKKEMWGLWDKLSKGEALNKQEARQLQEYTGQREGDYAKGVSTYKTEWERAKPLVDAIAPYAQLYQQHGVDPAQQVAKYAEIHKGLAFGSPEQKLGLIFRIAQDYQIPLHNLFQRGQDGNIYYNQQFTQQAQQPVRQQQPSVDIDRLIEEKLVARTTQQDIAAMQSNAEKYPHFEQVRDTMAGLLQAGLAQDLPSAYDAALRHPKHSEIWDAMQQQQRAADQAEQQRKLKEEAERARRNNVSPRTATPAGQASGPKKGLRATLEEAFDQHTASRV